MLFAAASGSLTSLVPHGAVIVHVGAHGAIRNVAVTSPNGDAAVGVWQFGHAGGLIIWVGAPAGTAAVKLDAVGAAVVPAFEGTMGPESSAQ